MKHCGPWKQGRKKQGRKKQGSITCCMDRANEATKMFFIWLCWLFQEKNEITWCFDKWSRARGLYGLLMDLKFTNHSTQNQSAINYNNGQYLSHAMLNNHSYSEARKAAVFSASLSLLASTRPVAVCGKTLVNKLNEPRSDKKFQRSLNKSETIQAILCHKTLHKSTT